MDIQNQSSSKYSKLPKQNFQETLQEVRVGTSYEFDVRGRELFHEIQKTLGIFSVTMVRSVKIYRLEGIEDRFVKDFALKILIDPLYQTFTINSPLIEDSVKYIEVAYKPGVMNPEILSLMNIAYDQKFTQLKAADTSWEYHFYGEVSEEELLIISKRLLVNDTVEHIVKSQPCTLNFFGSKSPKAFPVLLRNMNDEQLLALANERQLFLNIKEMKAIQSFFQNIGRDPFDLEVETLAQTWSEHCSHKTFKSPLNFSGQEKEPLFTRLKKVSKKYSENIVSAFVDNAGALKFYDGYAILAKVETHNSPSAIEPYGGAATGVGGVLRDIMGTGTGAKVIASTNIFCFARPDLPNDQVPIGCLHPHYLLRKVVAGVRDYGNRMGIPTNNGSVHFHDDFRAKPTVIVGAYGIAPEACANKRTPCIGDKIFVVGGATGRDGIHGATFSSGEMTDSTIVVHSTAVQIGNAIEEKRMSDALLICRDKNLIVSITDCGAGGLSSAVGEMGAQIGVEVELSKVPLKYDGLAPWEIWISESQERMVCAISVENVEEFINTCKEFNVLAIEIGIFTGTNQLVVKYLDQIVCDMPMDFLHNGLPIFSLDALENIVNNNNTEQKTLKNLNLNLSDLYCKILSDYNVCSKEPIVRQYDHGVQGTNALPPLNFKQRSGPNDAVVLCPILGKPYGVVISHGLNPILNRIDPYAGSIWAITEALSNLVAVGGDPANAGLIDNFIWPKPNKKLLGDLDAALQACLDAMNVFKIPFISGKDSLSSTYRYASGEILEIPPVLCISVMGKIPDVYKTISADFKKVGSYIILIGELDLMAMGGSIFQEIFGIKQNDKVPHIKLLQVNQIFNKLHTLIKDGFILACHDVSEGGLAITLAEMCFAADIGAKINLDQFESDQPENVLFNETAGCFLVEISQDVYDQNIFDGIPHKVLGKTIKEKNIIFNIGDQKLLDMQIEVLYQAWQRPMQEIF